MFTCIMGTKGSPAVLEKRGCPGGKKGGKNMNITTILKKLSEYKGSVYGERAYAEMLFLSSISQNEQNKYDALLQDAGEKLLARCQREGPWRTLKRA